MFLVQHIISVGPRKLL